jgi:hypothetical protein
MAGGFSVRLSTLVLVVTAVPMGYAMESGLRALLLPPELEALRRELSPALTEVAWVLFGLCFPASLVGLWAKRLLRRRILAGLARGATPQPAQQERAETEAYLLASSIPQIPALFATVASLGGASPVPVVAALAISTVGVVLQAHRAV